MKVYVLIGWDDNELNDSIIGMYQSKDRAKEALDKLNTRYFDSYDIFEYEVEE